jgi:hypothetical protein
VGTVQPPGDVRSVLADELDCLRQIVTGVSDAEFVRATACEGWRVADLLVHLRLDAEALLCGLVVPCDDSIDRDFISYWKDWPSPGQITFADVRCTWAFAAAYATADSLRGHVDEAILAAAMASRAAPAGRVRFQNHVLAIDDLLAMFAVEFALHHLDLLVAVPDRPGPEPDALELIVCTLDGLLDPHHPTSWDQLTYVRKATGRQPLDAADRKELGSKASRYPAFG